MSKQEHTSFMMDAQTTVQLPFGDRKVLVSVDSNCSKHMTGFYALQYAKPLAITVDGAIHGGASGQSTSVGFMTLGNLSFAGTVFVPGLRETILSLGQLDAQGCTTEIKHGKLHVSAPDGTFLFSAFLHNGRYFLDSKYYYGPTIHETVDAMILTDAPYDNTAELWHCRLGHVNQADLKRMQSVAQGILIFAPKHKLPFVSVVYCLNINRNLSRT